MVFHLMLDIGFEEFRALFGRTMLGAENRSRLAEIFRDLSTVGKEREGFVIEAYRLAGRDLNRLPDSVQRNFRTGTGEAHHWVLYYFFHVAKPHLKGLADLDRALLGGRTLDDALRERINSQVAPSDDDIDTPLKGPWTLECLSRATPAPELASFALRDFQPPATREDPLALFLEVFSEPVEIASGTALGFRAVTLRADVPPDHAPGLTVPEAYASPAPSVAMPRSNVRVWPRI